MSFAQYNSGVPVDTSGGQLGSSSSGVSVVDFGLKFLGVLISSILFLLVILVVWKLVEVLVERLRTGSADGPPSADLLDLRRRNPEEEKEEVKGGCMAQVAERVKTIAGRYKRPLNPLLLLRPEATLSTHEDSGVAVV